MMGPFWIEIAGAAVRVGQGLGLTTFFDTINRDAPFGASTGLFRRENGNLLYNHPWLNDIQVEISIRNRRINFETLYLHLFSVQNTSVLKQSPSPTFRKPTEGHVSMHQILVVHRHVDSRLIVGVIDKAYDCTLARRVYPILLELGAGLRSQCSRSQDQALSCVLYDRPMYVEIRWSGFVSQLAIINFFLTGDYDSTMTEKDRIDSTARESSNDMA
jgi:hypothetical protein